MRAGRRCPLGCTPGMFERGLRPRNLGGGFGRGAEPPSEKKPPDEWLKAHTERKEQS